MSFPHPEDRAVAVCWVDASRVTPDEAAAWVQRLPPDERDRFHRYRHPMSAHEFLAGRLLIRGWLEAISGSPALSWRFSEGPRGRPEIAEPASPWSFNLAHSGGLVACVLSRLPGVGVDLEDLERLPMTRELTRRYCAPAEIADIERLPETEQARRFLTYWTLKEAYLKARGLGIAVQLSDLEFTLEGPHPAVAFNASLAGTSAEWAFELFRPTPRYLLSVAAPHPEGTPRPVIALHGLSMDALTAV